MLRAALAIGVLVGMAGCYAKATPAKVFRVRGRTLHACTMHLGWTKDQMFSECGGPQGTLDRSGGGTCYVYESLASAFAGGGAGAVAACFDRGKVTEVYGLSKLPYFMDPERKRTRPKPTVPDKTQ